MLGNFCYKATVLQTNRVVHKTIPSQTFFEIYELLHLIKNCIMIFQELMKNCMMKLSNSDGNWL